ncbi:MAG: hypothetical protein PVH60_09655 [Anaerolineales bacterium]|jgi:deazaflavin-dependent oxidoreductase (nitroreductase family)
MSQSYQSFRQRGIDLARSFNKHFLNRIMLKLAETGRGPYTTIYHIGRRSGRHYRTPVFASYNYDTIIIPLPYGENVDWLRNILANGDCEIVGNKSRIKAADPELLSSKVATPLLPRWRGTLFQIFKIENFLRLKVMDRRAIRNSQ